MAEWMQCAICSKELTEPRTLPCGHTFCVLCLQRRIDQAGNLQCPIDSSLFNVPGGDAHNLMRNYTLEEAMYEARHGPRTLKPESCPVHSRQAAIFFCETCKRVLCAVCVLEEHRAHKFVSYEEGLEVSRKTLSDQISSVDRFNQILGTMAIDTLVKSETEKQQNKMQSTVTLFETVIQLLNSALKKYRTSANEAARKASDSIRAKSTEQLQLRLKVVRDEMCALRSVKILSVLLAESTPLKKSFDGLRSDFRRYESEPTELLSFSIDEQLTSDLSAILAQARNFDGKLGKQEYNFIDRKKSATEPQTEVLLCVGGYHDGEHLKKADLYDSDRNSWGNVAPMSTARKGVAAAAWNGKVVVVGGVDQDHKSLNSAEQYDPETNKWTPFSSLLAARQLHALVNVNNVDDTLFAIGGWNCVDLSSVERYNARSGKWQPAPALKIARSGLASAPLQTGILVAGGTRSGAVESTCEFFNCDRNEWATVAPLNTARSLASATTYVNTVYVFGGRDSKDSYLNNVEQYNYAANKWTVLQARLTVARSHLPTACVNGRFFLVGGWNGSGQSVDDHQSMVDCFDPIEERFSNVSPLSQPRSHSAVASVRIFGDCTEATVETLTLCNIVAWYYIIFFSS